MAVLSIFILYSNSLFAEGFTGNYINLNVGAPAPSGWSFDAVVNENIELSPRGTNGNVFVVPIEIDLTNNTIFFDYSVGGSGWFYSGIFNGYIFTDKNHTMNDIINVTIDPDYNTLGVTPDRVWFNKDQIFVNVESLYYNSLYTLKLNVEFSDTPSPSTSSPYVIPIGEGKSVTIFL